MSTEKQFVHFENVDQVNQHLNSIDTNKLAEQYLRRTEGGNFQGDSIAIGLLINALLHQVFYK